MVVKQTFLRHLVLQCLLSPVYKIDNKPKFTSCAVNAAPGLNWHGSFEMNICFLFMYQWRYYFSFNFCYCCFCTNPAHNFTTKKTNLFIHPASFIWYETIATAKKQSRKILVKDHAIVFRRHICVWGISIVFIITLRE